MDTYLRSKETSFNLYFPLPNLLCEILFKTAETTRDKLTDEVGYRR